MASRATLTVLFGFYAIFFCLYLLEESTAKTGTTRRSGLATAALAPALLITLALTALLTYAHVWALGRANAGGAGAGARFVARLAEATLLAAAVALLSGAAVRLGAAGEVLRLGGAADVGWLGLGHKEEEHTSLLRMSSLMHHAVWDDVVNVESDGTRLVVALSLFSHPSVSMRRGHP